MKDFDGLRTELSHLAGEVKSVDLYDRALVTSRRLRVQRLVAAASGLATIAVAATVVVNLGGPSPQPPPLPLAPSPTVLPSPPPDPAPPSIAPFANAFVTVPSWGAADTRCVSGRVRLEAGGQYVPTDETKTVLNVMAVVASDVDGDGDQDYVADLMCGEGPESPGRQVVAFQRNGSELTSLGVIVQRDTGDIGMISEIADRGNGRIAVLVSNAYGDGGYQFVPSQWRVYARQSGQWRQVEGPTSFPADPPAVNVTVVGSARLDFHYTAEGLYAGELIFTVRNDGRLDAANLEMRLFLTPEINPAGGGWDGCHQAVFPSEKVVRCDLPPLAAGATRELRYTLLSATSTITNQGKGLVPPPYLDVEQVAPFQYEKGMPRTVPVVIAWPPTATSPPARGSAR